VGSDPVTVQLLFEPSGRPVDEQNYYLHEKDNVCVVCGAADSYIRKNIIPREYRKYASTLTSLHLLTYLVTYILLLFVGGFAWWSVSKWYNHCTLCLRKNAPTLKRYSSKL